MIDLQGPVVARSGLEGFRKVLVQAPKASQKNSAHRACTNREVYLMPLRGC